MEFPLLVGAGVMLERADSELEAEGESDDDSSGSEG
jgi:hypothetical protein